MRGHSWGKIIELCIAYCDFALQLEGRGDFLERLMRFRRSCLFRIGRYMNLLIFCVTTQSMNSCFVFQSECIDSIKTSVLYVDGKESMITLDYTVDPSKASDDFMEEGEEPAAKKRKSSEGEVRYSIVLFHG